MSIFETIKRKGRIEYKFLGLNLYEKVLNKEERHIKTKYLAGVFYKKFDIYSKTFKFKICGFSLLYTKLKNSFKIWYFLFIPIWIKNANKEFLEPFLDEIISKHPSHDSYYVFLSRSGEFFLLMHHFKQWLDNNKSVNPMLIFTAKYHLDICKMFFPNVPMTYIKNVNVSIVSRCTKSVSFKYRNKQIYIPTNEKYFVNVENQIRNNSAHYYECLKEHLGLSNNIGCYKISERTKEKVARIVRYILDDNFVFISPETLSCELIEKEFWNKLAKEFKTRGGYKVFCNITDFKNSVEDSASMFLTYEEAIELSKYAKAIVGMRSGFIECLSQNNVPLYVLYTDFPKRSGFRRLKSDKVIKGFSISKLPNVNKDLLHQYDVNSYNDETLIINDIISNFRMRDAVTGKYE